MPYISIPRRPPLDPIIDGLLKRLREIGCRKGDINYTVTRIAVEALNNDSYHSISDCISVLRDAADEIARRLLGPYEDTAILRNGDLECFQTYYAYMPLNPVPLPSPIPPFGPAPDPAPVNEVDGPSYCLCGPDPAPVNKVAGNVVVDSPLSGDPFSDDVPPIEKTTRELINAHIEWRKRRDYPVPSVPDLNMSDLVSTTDAFCDISPEACEGTGPTDD
jgi:hypothetical protein